MRSLEMPYPMYLISVAALHNSTTWSSTEDMLEKGLVRAGRPSLSDRTIFVSHEWMGWKHTDPPASDR